MDHDVFISYSSKDKPIADAICANLERGGIRCWIAPRDIAPGEDWPAASYEDAYAAASRYILDHHCDVLLAIWDGVPERGKGGGGTVAEARLRGLAFAWVHAGSDAGNDGVFERFPALT